MLNYILLESKITIGQDTQFFLNVISFFWYSNSIFFFYKFMRDIGVLFPFILTAFL